MKVEDLLNRSLAGYGLREVLGRGGMSIVFLAQRLNPPEDTAAMKILLPPDLSSTVEFATFQARFLREARSNQLLQHEHILPVFDYGEEDGLFYMLMPLVANGSLAQHLDVSESLPLETSSQYLCQLASAVEYAHQHGLVHRDIKPSNILLDAEGSIYLADFGIVRLFDQGALALDEVPTALTTTGQIYGTPTYMAPERFQGIPAEPATDIYALGVLLYQLVTGRVPFEADNALAIGMKHLNEEPLRPRALRPDLPAPAEAAILQALAKNPTERFATASALATAFAAGLRNEWAPELGPQARAFAEEPTEKLKRPVRAAAALMETTAPHRPASTGTADGQLLAIPPTNRPGPYPPRPQSHFWRRLQVVSFILLGLVLLSFMVVLALAVSKMGLPVPAAPGMQARPTSTLITPHPHATATSRQSATTPVAGATPTAGASAGVTPAPQPTPTPGITPTEAPPAPTPTPTVDNTSPTPPESTPSTSSTPGTDGNP